MMKTTESFLNKRRLWKFFSPCFRISYKSAQVVKGILRKRKVIWTIHFIGDFRENK